MFSTPIVIFSLILSVIIPNLIGILNYFPYFGFSLSLLGIALLILITHPQKDKNSLLLSGFALIFILMLILRANPLLTLFNFVFIIYLLSSLASRTKYTLWNLFLSPLSLFLQTFKTTFPFVADPKLRKFNISNKTLTSLIITFFSLIIIVPLLSSANPIFGKWVKTILQAMYDVRLLFEIDPETLLVFTIRLILTLVLAFLLPKFVNIIGKKTPKTNLGGFSSNNISLLIPKVSIIVVLGIFFISQAQLYFASSQTLEALGYTHSRYAREVFGQLSVVFLIVFSLIYNDKGTTKLAKPSSIILLLQLLFLNLMSLKSVWEYSAQWGLTQKRLYGFSTVVWLFGILMLFSYHYVKKLSSTLFIKRSLFLSCTILLLINVANFDYLIFHTSKSRTGEGIDHLYLSGLSFDSMGLREHFLFLADVIIKDNEMGKEHEWKMYTAARREFNNIQEITNKYQHFDLRTFNLSEFMTYQTVRDLDLHYYDEQINTAYRKINMFPISDPTIPQSDVALETSGFAQEKSLTLSQDGSTSVSVSVPNQIHPMPTTVQTPSRIPVKIINLDPIYHECNYQIKKDGNVVVEGSLDDNDTLSHLKGSGIFSLILLKLDAHGNWVHGKELSYEVRDTTETVKINFNQ